MDSMKNVFCTVGKYFLVFVVAMVVALGISAASVAFVFMPFGVSMETTVMLMFPMQLILLCVEITGFIWFVRNYKLQFSMEKIEKEKKQLQKPEPCEGGQ